MTTARDTGIERILAPRSIAVVGASRDPRKRGYQAIASLLESRYAGPIYPVNPRETEILGLRTYPTLSAIEGEIDLAFVAIPAAAVSAVLRECGQSGVRGAVVVAVGFGETGEDGRAREHEIVRVAAASGLRVVGPNTSGIFNLPRGVNLVGLRKVPPGRIAVLAQSGNMLLSLVAEAQVHDGAGFSVYVGVGNESDVRYDEYLAYLGGDPRTGAIAVYAEGFKDGRRLLRAARAIAPAKPVVMLKAGRSEVGRRSALSHTGALAGSARVAEAALKQAGVIVVRRSDELLPVARALESLPPLAGPRVAVLADGGGHATLAADAAAEYRSLELPELSAETQAELAALLPEAASTRNPVDVAGATDSDPGLFADCLEALLGDDEVDGVLMVGLFGGYGTRFAKELEAAEIRCAERFGELVAAAAKPLIVQSAYAPVGAAAHGALGAAGIPVYGSIEIAVRSLAALGERARYLRTYSERSDFRLEASMDGVDGHRALTEPDGRRLIAAAGLPVGEWILATNAREAQQAAARIGAPVALKVVSPQLPHKSDVGGVQLGVPASQAGIAFEELLERVVRRAGDVEVVGVLVERMAEPGVELAVGALHDPSFGPIVMVGLGGVLVEHLDDVSLRAAPITRLEALEMLDELAGSALLDGARGGPSVDRRRVAELIVAVSGLVSCHPEIAEIDLNPVIAGPEGVALVDVRVVVGEGS